MSMKEGTKTAVLAIVSLAIIVVTGLSLYAQQNVGSIKGTVEDPSGGAIPGAMVVARDEATGVERKTVTNKAGAYAFPQLDIGFYTLTVSATGFKTTERSSIRLIAGVALKWCL
jgi:Carboxypeptidase regulatory-like domain